MIDASSVLSLTPAGQSFNHDRSFVRYAEMYACRGPDCQSLSEPGF